MSQTDSDRGGGRHDTPPTAPPPPGTNPQQYGAKYLSVWTALGVPLDQARPPAGAMGDLFAVRPGCEQLTWIYNTNPAPSWQAITITPDHGQLIWQNWIVPHGNAGTKLDAQKAMSAGGICKLEGQTIPLLTHEDVKALYSQSLKIESAPPATDWASLAMVAVGGVLVAVAAVAHYVKGKDVLVEESAQFEAFQRSFGGRND